MHSFVISAERLVLLNRLAGDYPRPIGLQWINRGTNQMLNQSSVDLIMRTLYQPVDFSESVQRLHRTAGLRVIFASEDDRAKFAAAFRAAAATD